MNYSNRVPNHYWRDDAPDYLDGEEDIEKRIGGSGKK